MTLSDGPSCARCHGRQHKDGICPVWVPRMTRRRMLPVDARRYARSVARTERLHRRRERGMFRAAIARARQLVERVCRPLGLQFFVQRDRGLVLVVVLDVHERPGMEIIEGLADAGELGGLVWVGRWSSYTGEGAWAYLPTRADVHGETRERCRWASEAHAPGCECDACGEVPF